MRLLPGWRRGYTIVEMLVVMAVMGILASAAMPLAELAARRSKERELKQALWEIRRAIDAYKRAYDDGVFAQEAGASGYPASLRVLVNGMPDTREPGRTLYFLRRVPADPFAPPGTVPEAGWELRSYASSPDRPQAGADVYDVHSRSDGAGMNGIPYRQW